MFDSTEGIRQILPRERPLLCFPWAQRPYAAPCATSTDPTADRSTCGPQAPDCRWVLEAELCCSALPEDHPAASRGCWCLQGRYLKLFLSCRPARRSQPRLLSLRFAALREAGRQIPRLWLASGRTGTAPDEGPPARSPRPAGLSQELSCPSVCQLLHFSRAAAPVLPGRATKRVCPWYLVP